MTALTAFHGALATFVLASLILVEEIGVPLPFAPGDLVLIAAGVLIATGEMSPWAFIPAAIIAGIGGGIAGYSWTRAIGERGLRALAGRLHLGGRLERLEARVQRAGPGGIIFSRLLIPGMRVNTTLLAGGLGVPPRIFLLGLVPSVLIWVGVFTGLGVLVGLPVAQFLSRIDHALLDGAALLAVGVIGYLVARHVPSRRGDDPLRASGGWVPLLLAAVIDLATIASVVAGADAIGRDLLHNGGIDDVIDAAITIGAIVGAYLLAARGSVGRTAGEALLRVSYRPRRRPRDGE
jgi:membrane protein DedA with SNARE-associated domain